MSFSKKQKNYIAIVAVAAILIVLALIFTCLVLLKKSFSKKTDQPSVTIEQMDLSLNGQGDDTQWSEVKDKFVTYRETRTIHFPNPVFEDSVEISEYNPSTWVYKKSIDIQWPVTLDGVGDISMLQKALMKVVFGTTYPDMETALKYFWDEAPSGPYGAYDYLTVEQIAASSSGRVRFRITRNFDLGTGAGSLTAGIRKTMLVYDKQTQQIIDQSEVVE